MPFDLTITPLQPADLPPEDEILAAGRELLDSTADWKEGKTYNGVRTLSRAKRINDGAPWHCRLSEHTTEEASFDAMWSKLGVNKAENEKEFVPNIQKATLVKQISPTQAIWTLYYTFPPPVSPRVFTVLQVTNLSESSPRTGIVVSVPIDLSSSSDAELAKLEEHGVRGRYASIERIRELENGKTEWRMATSSTPGGSIPTFVVERTMAGKIAEDVPHFMKWLHSLPKER